MEKERGFNFKLLVPPRVGTGQVSAVKPQEVTADNFSFTQPLHAANIFNKCHNKDLNMPFGNTKVMSTSESVKTAAARKIAVIPMEKDQKARKYSELYSELFVEAEKIKCWKVKMESEITQKNRKLQENKKTIENQRKAIQELQFGNESLSVKLEDKMTENADLKNKNNATRNLCNILKDAFERSAEKMNLYESERQETHHLFLQNSDTIQRMITAFEALRVQSEVDRHEMLKFKKELQAYEDIKERFQNELRIKQEEVITLQAKMKDKESKLKEILQNFQDTQQNCIQFQEEARKYYEMLEASKQEQEGLFEKLQRAEQSNKETVGNMQTLKTALEQKETEYTKILTEKDSCLDKLNKLKGEQEEKFMEIETAALILQKSLSSEKQRAKELEESLSSVTEELKRTNGKLGEVEQKKDEKERQLTVLREDLDIKAKSLMSLEQKLQMVETTASQLAMDLQSKNAEISQLQNKLQIQNLEKKHADDALETIQQELKDLKEMVQIKEVELFNMREKLCDALRNGGKSDEEINNLRKDIEDYRKSNGELMASLNKLQIQNEIVAQQTSGNVSEAEVLEVHLEECKANEKKTKKEMKKLEEENYQLKNNLESLSAKVKENDEERKTIQEKYEKSIQSLKKEIVKKEKLLNSLEMKLITGKAKLENKTKAQEERLRENRNLKKQLATESENFHKLENELNEIKEQLIKSESLHNEELKNLQEDIEVKAASEAELQQKVQKLSLEALEAAKSKEEVELKCQQKISDMVALMEKHKNQYDKMVQEKDAELFNTRKKVAEINANNTSLELELSETKSENSHLKQQLQNESNKRDKLKQKIKTLNIEIESVHEDIQQKRSEQGPKEIRCIASQNPAASLKSMKQSVFSFLAETENDNVIKTPSLGSVSKRLSSTPQIKHSGTDILKTPNWSSIRKASANIKSYRVRTPPSTGKSMPLKKNTLELDPRSDSSDQNDLLSFSVEHKLLRSVQSDGGPHHQCGNPNKKSQSPAVTKSPGTALKLAAVKRMRDAGWTAVTSTEKKKKKKKNENIFA